MTPGRTAGSWTCVLRCETDRVWCAGQARSFARVAGLDERAQWEVATAVAELVGNAIKYAGAGVLRLSVVAGPEPAMEVEVSDRGPGITGAPPPRVDATGHLAQRDGLGLGLGTVRRLMSSMQIESAPGQGTRITAVKRLTPKAKGAP